MIRNLFQKKKDKCLCAPCLGTLIPLEQVKDAMFAQKLLGDGIAIIPHEEMIASPCDGKLMMIAPTSHAFGIRMDNDAEILVHVGLDTVNLQGKGFEVLAHVGQKVKAGTPILRVDLDYMRKQQMDVTIPVIVTNQDGFMMEKRREVGEVNSMDVLMMISK